MIVVTKILELGPASFFCTKKLINGYHLDSTCMNPNNIFAARRIVPNNNVVLVIRYLFDEINLLLSK